MNPFSFRSIATQLFIVLALVGCGGGGGGTELTEPNQPVTNTVPIKPRSPVVILVFGDSLSSGWGIPAGADWVSLMAQKIKNERIDEFASVQVINASEAGEFAIFATSRLPGVLAAARPTHVLLAHGTNDSRTSLPWPTIADALSQMVLQSKAAGAKPLLLDITHTSYGTDHAAAYSKTFQDVSYLQGIPYVHVTKGITDVQLYYDPVIPFHLTPAAQPLMLNNVWAELEKTF